MRQGSKEMCRSIPSMICQARPSHKSQAVWAALTKCRDYRAPVTHTLWHCLGQPHNQGKAYQTQAAVQATPREPCPSCSWLWPRLWDLSQTCWAGSCLLLYSPNHRLLEGKRNWDLESISKDAMFWKKSCFLKTWGFMWHNPARPTSLRPDTHTNKLKHYNHQQCFLQI